MTDDTFSCDLSIRFDPWGYAEDDELEVLVPLPADDGHQTVRDLHAPAGDNIEEAVFAVPEPAPQDVVLRHDALVWMTSPDRDLAAEEILPVALFDRDCWWRDAVLAGLEAAERPYRIAFTSESAIGVRATVEAGIAAALLDQRAGAVELTPVPNLDLRHPSFLVLRQGSAASGQALEVMSEGIRRAYDTRGSRAGTP